MQGFACDVCSDKKICAARKKKAARSAQALAGTVSVPEFDTQGVFN